jgi:hypothetical protein
VKTYIGSCFEKLDGALGSFTVEVFGSILKKAWIEEALAEAGRETKRERKLPACFTVWLIISMAFYRNLSIDNILNRMGNLMGVGSLWSEGETPASSSTAEARDRVGLDPLRLLVARLRDWLLQTYRPSMLWKGLWLLALDGTTFKVPDGHENRRYFGLPGSSRGRSAFPQMRALFLVSVPFHFIVESIFAPYGSAEIPLALNLLASIPVGSLVLLDRNFNAWQFLLGLQDRGSYFLVRAKKNMKGEIVSILGPGDCLVRMKIPRALRRRCPLLPETVVVREISAYVEGKPFRFFSSLLDPATHSAAELIRLYHQRWEGEITLDAIKTHQCGATTVNRPVIFRCKTSARVLQEAYGLVLAYNLIRALMAEAAQHAHIPPVRISFVDSLERIRSAALLMAAAPTEALPVIYNDLIRSIAGCQLPPRRKRNNPRAVCIKMSAYPLKKKSA